MHTQKLYGSSDDLVCLSGDVDDELPGGDKPTYVRFSTGTSAKVWYDDDGVWKVELLTAGRAETRKLHGLPDDADDSQKHNDEDAPNYSDVLVIKSKDPITLEAHGRKPLKEPPPGLAKAKAVIECLDSFGGFDEWWHDIQQDDKNEILEKLAKLLHP